MQDFSCNTVFLICLLKKGTVTHNNASLNMTVMCFNIHNTTAGFKMIEMLLFESAWIIIVQIPDFPSYWFNYPLTWPLYYTKAFQRLIERSNWFQPFYWRNSSYRYLPCSLPPVRLFFSDTMRDWWHHTQLIAYICVKQLGAKHCYIAFL